MDGLIKINYDTERLTVSARDLHEGLSIEKRFSAWFESNSNGFVEGEDFTSVLIGTEVKNNGGVQFRQLKDYQITIDMAKHIALMSRTAKGKEIRQQFIELERSWNTPEQVMARALKMAEKEMKRLKSDNTVLLASVEEMKPKAQFADSVSGSDTSILVRDLAKILRQNGVDIGGNRLFEWLREKGYLIKQRGDDWNMPTQMSMNLGLFEIKETVIHNPDKPAEIRKTPKVTGKGQQYFINKLLGCEMAI